MTYWHICVRRPECLDTLTAPQPDELAVVVASEDRTEKEKGELPILRPEASPSKNNAGEGVCNTLLNVPIRTGATQPNTLSRSSQQGRDQIIVQDKLAPNIRQ